MTKDFNSFWAEFQVLASELDHNKSILISELKFKLTSLLFRAMAGDVSQPKNIHKYVKQCQEAYQDLKDIKIQTSAANIAGNWYNQETNMNTSTNTGTNAKTANRNERSTNSLYSHLPSSVASNSAVTMRLMRSKTTRLTWEKIAKLQREDCCFTCKEVDDYQLKCSNRWWPMSVFTNVGLALAWINISEVAILQLGYIKAENKWLR